MPTNPNRYEPTKKELEEHQKLKEKLQKQGKVKPDEPKHRKKEK